ncbi:MAG: hypothetical protein ACK559_12835 [bacterium]
MTGMPLSRKKTEPICVVHGSFGMSQYAPAVMSCRMSVSSRRFS